MRLAAAFAACLLCAAAADAYQPVQPVQPDEAQLREHGHYRNRDGDEVHAPAHTKDGRVPEGASARCRDGSYSFSRHRSGTCSHHGGVAEWQ
ncbi:DUF3761 domain-containing protein [Burkholderia glumae]|uniref:DUF3761 domain-containing protein n=1 Tax=Burkholderia glumae TaxID=337 RepID=A0AAQ0BVY8_BURGL|nr:DUF3761 domain-containing protein [Burkholderia glumae]ACR29604.1 Hypothetical protein bglu_1g25280 [Burkholderia glumae BGR1]AJY65906.1 hypothetical protein KS03_3299 [Burkholderia glumae LMG 2196 = ATCC 33617]KHJ62613.1 hypothetical protein NCPPB3923_12575 [Burkholderia glumae]MCM2482727.1 DUF3761 domain-containing protein [Burkholderia glumae]MCM2507131.1 DUF3761 domain-containing protein [Burkholderia glumae]